MIIMQVAPLGAVCMIIMQSCMQLAGSCLYDHHASSCLWLHCMGAVCDSCLYDHHASACMALCTAMGAVNFDLAIQTSYS